MLLKLTIFLSEGTALGLSVKIYFQSPQARNHRHPFDSLGVLHAGGMFQS